MEEGSSPYNICILNLTTKWNLDINTNIGTEGQQTQRMMRTLKVWFYIPKNEKQQAVSRATVCCYLEY